MSQNRVTNIVYTYVNKLRTVFIFVRTGRAEGLTAVRSSGSLCCPAAVRHTHTPVVVVS